MRPAGRLRAAPEIVGRISEALFERGLDGRERGLHLAAHPGDDRDENNRDSRGNEAVLDRSCGAFILQEGDQFAHGIKVTAEV